MDRIYAVFGALVMVAALAAQGTTSAPAGEAAATGPALAVSAAGEPAGGLTARLRGPASIEENDFLEMSLELATDAKSLPADVRLLDLHLFEDHCRLTLKDTNTGKSFTVQPFDASAGMLDRDDGRQNVTLDVKPLNGLQVMFPLRTAHVPTGEYDCTVTFEGKRPTDAAPNYWLATLTTGVLKIKVEKETPKTFTAYVPKALRRDADGILRVHAEDLEQVTLPKGNGLMSGCMTSVNGEMKSLSGGISGPKDLNLEGFIRAEAGKTTEVSITIFVTGTPAQHFWSPASDEENYKVVWSRSYDGTGVAKVAAPKAN